MFPNDYEKLAAKRNAEKVIAKAEERRKEAEEREKYV